MEFRLLGAVSVATETGELPLGPAKRRSVLAALLLRPNTAVPVDQLIDTIWDETPPAHARTVVQGHVSRLRALLNDGEAAAYGVELATRGRAYVLQMSESLLDAHRFEELVQLAKRQRQPADTVLMLREALALWRGPALTGTVSSEQLLAAAHALEETRLVTVENLAEAYGALGEHGRAAAVLRAEAVAHPMRESLASALMLALYRAGRQSDALDWYHRTRRLLAAELGVDPGRALQDAYGAILQGEAIEETAGGPQAHPRPHPSTHTSAHTHTHAADSAAMPGRAHEAASVQSPAVGGSSPGGALPGRPGPLPGPVTTATAPRGAEARVPGQGVQGDQERHVPNQYVPNQYVQDQDVRHQDVRHQHPADRHPSGQRAPETVDATDVAGAGAGPGVPALPAGSPADSGAPADAVRVAQGRTTTALAVGSALDTAEDSGARAGSGVGSGVGPDAGPGFGPASDSDLTAPFPADAVPVTPGAPTPGAPTPGAPAPTPTPTPTPCALTPGTPVPQRDCAPHVPYTVPELLARRPRGFLGRGADLAAVDTATAGAEAPIAVVTGPAGVGKTALALHWAHGQRESFPDGRLFADLHGFDLLADPEPADVLREFLLALGVPGYALPETPATAAALYRRLTTGRRLLVVLDNARSSEQVRPLLPAGDACVTVVTSRNRLGGLIAGDLARPVPLDTLGPDDSVALLARVLGEQRVAAEPEAAQRLAALCEGLPLALRITAARLTSYPDRPLERHAAELADEQRRLTLLQVEDRGVEAELRLSLQQLDACTQRVFRGLGTHTGPTVDRYAAAALAGLPVAETTAALDRLAAAHLVQESGTPGQGRYALHDLVRLFARSTSDDPGALPRLLDHYLLTELAANAVAEQGSRPCCSLPDDIQRPVQIRQFASRDEVIEWYAAEREALAGAMTAATAAAAATADGPESGLADRVWRLGILQWPYILWRVRDGWTPMLEVALAAAVALDDPEAESRVRALLGWVLVEEERTEEAYPHLELAPVLAARTGDLVDEAIGRVNLSVAQCRRGSVAQAQENCVRAAALARRAGDRQTEMLALQSLADHCLRAGEPEAALRHSLDGLALGPADVGVIRRVLLRTAQGESLTQLGRVPEGLELLCLAAQTAEREGFHEGACRALSVLLRITGDRAAYEDRYQRAMAALADHGEPGRP
ncbi:BTAD domain-containing putative transcriptional regulator [Streptomyces sp. NPDC021093]|uniref:BTAD domain-containing putative transcriptional regulator n=1 Tax=Streptomyces sp. NPDC021093 TaxID=3365112 RepID=UPI003795FE04